MNTQRIRRITATPVVVPIPVQRINCPRYAHEPLNRGPTGGWDGPYFGTVPFLVIKVEGDGGPAGFGTTVRNTDAAAFRRITASLLGKPIDAVVPRMELGGDGAYRGIHTAALDWRARCEGVPLHRLFGPQLRPGVTAAEWTAFRTPEGAARFAAQARARGFTCLKLKSSHEQPDEEIAGAVYEAAGPDFRLVIDPNGRWGTVDEALRRARAVAAVAPNVWLEDPVYGEGAMEALIQIRNLTPLKSIKTVIGGDYVDRFASAGAVDAMNCQGIWPLLLEASAAASRHGIPYWVGSSVESTLADAAIIHFGVTQEMFRFPCEMAGNLVREHGLTRTPIRYQDGMAMVPPGPGLGVEADEDAIERYRVADPVVLTG